MRGSGFAYRGLWQGSCSTTRTPYRVHNTPDQHHQPVFNDECVIISRLIYMYFEINTGLRYDHFESSGPGPQYSPYLDKVLLIFFPTFLFPMSSLREALASNRPNKNNNIASKALMARREAMIVP